jgi:hypothetical protein
MGVPVKGDPMNLFSMLMTHLEPEHLFALSVIVFAFLGFAIPLTWRWFSVQRRLSRIMSESQQILKSVKHVDHATYDLLCEKFANNSLVEHSWNEFSETVIQEDSGETVQIFNTKSFSEFFQKDEFFEHHLHTTFYRKIPSLLTSIGLCFTFIFIVVGLSHLHMEQSGKIAGIQGLIEGLSAKFVSSILALILSIAFTLFEGSLIKRAENKYRQFMDLLDKKFQRKISEDYLRSLDKNMRELNLSMKHFSTDLAGVIKEGLHEGMRPSTDRLLIAIENLEKQKTENIADTLAKLLTDFRSGLNQSTGNEFAVLASSITKLAAVMNESAERSLAMSGKMDGLLRTLDSQMQKQEQVSDASVTKLQQGFTQLLASIESTTKTQNQTLTQILEDMVNRSSVTTNEVINNVGALTQKNAGVVEGFSALNLNLSKNLDSYKEAVNSTQSLIKTTGELAGNVASSLNQLASLQGRIDTTYQNFMEQTVTVQQVQKENAQSVDRYRSVFREVESGLETVLRQLGDNIQRYNDLTKTGLESYLKQYDSSLSNATAKLSSTVKDLDEVLENLGDHIETIRTTAAANGKNAHVNE